MCHGRGSLDHRTQRSVRILSWLNQRVKVKKCKITHLELLIRLTEVPYFNRYYASSSVVCIEVVCERDNAICSNVDGQMDIEIIVLSEASQTAKDNRIWYLL